MCFPCDLVQGAGSVSPPHLLLWICRSAVPEWDAAKLQSVSTLGHPHRLAVPFCAITVTAVEFCLS